MSVESKMDAAKNEDSGGNMPADDARCCPVLSIGHENKRDTGMLNAASQHLYFWGKWIW
jgi:hypothetical protein